MVQEQVDSKESETLKCQLETPEGALNFTFAELNQKAALFELPSHAREAWSQALDVDPEFQEQVYRGTLLGLMLGQTQNLENTGNDVTAKRLSLQELIVTEINKYGHPLNNKGLLKAGSQSKGFLMFANSVNEKGEFSEALKGS